MILVAAWNGYVIVWGNREYLKTTKSGFISYETPNESWHNIGWLIRAFFTAMALAYVYPNWVEIVRISALSLIFGHAMYNIIINKIRKFDWDYVGSAEGGTVSWIDKLTTPTIFRFIFFFEIVLVVIAFLLPVRF